MKLRKHGILGSFASLSVAGSLFWGCSGTVQSSTEVENEIAARSLQGVAMDSVALDSAAWSAWDASGALIAQGVTDSVGGFSAALARSPVGGIAVRVVRGRDTLRALVGLDTTVVRSGVATILVHHLTAAAMPPGLDPSRGFAEGQVLRARERGQHLMDSVLGVSLPWSDLATDPTFRAVAPSRGGKATPLSGFIRALSVRAARDGMSGSDWIGKQESAVRALAEDTQFAVDLAGSMATLRLPQEQTTEFVHRLDEASGRKGAWEDAWKNRQILPDASELAARVPWAAKPENQPIWQRLVEVTGDLAADYENKLPPPARANLVPGRSHEIVAVAVGTLIAPDSNSGLPGSKVALDAFLARELPQAFLLLDQTRPEVWGPPPVGAEDHGASDGGISVSVSQVLTKALQTRLPSPWSYGIYQTQSDPSAWMVANLRPFGSAREAAIALDSLRTAHPEMKLPPNLLK